MGAERLRAVESQRPGFESTFCQVLVTLEKPLNPSASPFLHVETGMNGDISHLARQLENEKR